MNIPQDKIIVLCHSSNGMLEAMSVDEALVKFNGEFEYDKGNNAWSWPKGDLGHRGPFEVSRSRYIRETHRHGVIGIYQSDNLESINSMLYAAYCSTEETAHEGPYSD